MKIKICESAATFEAEPFLKPFGFKGKKLTGVWQTVVGLASENEVGIGLGIQSPLWSDGNVFAANGEKESNRLMFAVTEFAAGQVKGKEYASPEEILDDIFAACLEFARKTVSPYVTETFVLNALVPLDMAAWQLFARLGKENSFDFVFENNTHGEKLANIPLITYGIPLSDVAKMADDGVCLFKIKIGSDPDGDGDLDKMLAWDKARASELHGLLKNYATPYTESGRIAYYFDANGRYDTKERLVSFIDHLKAEGIVENTLLFEEPFPADRDIYVGDLPICFAADESIHSMADVKRRIAEGYGALTLKPIAKTVTLTKRMVEAAKAAGVQCFCADLTVNPVMLEWNKNFAARIAPIRGMKIGVVESNGGQNYKNWEEMKTYVTRVGTESDATVYTLDSTFYSNAGGLFEISGHYLELLASQNPQFKEIAYGK